MRLTEGLSETINELDTKFGNTSTDSDPGIETQIRGEPSPWIQECRKKTSYFAHTIDTIIDARERSVISQMLTMVVYPLILIVRIATKHIETFRTSRALWTRRMIILPQR